MSRFAILEKIRQLDPEKDHQEIVYLSTGFEFPFDTTRSLEFALYRTYAVPSMSGVLDHSGEFYARPQKRYDDTAIIVAELMEYGYDSERGHAAIRHMNRMHRMFDITNEQMLYVLSTFVFEPIRWNARFGWRQMCDQEKRGLFYFWREIGRRMNIQDIPATLEDFERFNLAFEAEHYQYGDTNRKIGEATRDLFLSWFPAPLRPLIKPFVYAMMDDRLLDTFGFPHPPAVLRPIASGGLKLRGMMIRYFRPRRKPRAYTKGKHRSYPEGYHDVSQLGPPHLREQ